MLPHCSSLQCFISFSPVLIAEEYWHVVVVGTTATCLASLDLGSVIVDV
jgi:hypothetical protein